MISKTELRQVAYIFKCGKSTLQIKGKINSIIIGRAELWICTHYDKLLRINMLIVFRILFCFVFLDNCKKFGLVFDNVVGIVEVINSKDIQMQVSGPLNLAQPPPDHPFCLQGALHVQLENSYCLFSRHSSVFTSSLKPSLNSVNSPFSPSYNPPCFAQQLQVYHFYFRNS